MKDDELILISPLDQPLPADTEEFSKRVETMIIEAVKQHDLSRALNVCKELVQAQKVSGLALAKALFLIRQHWDEFVGDESEDFIDVVYEYVGLHRHTVERYLAIWEMFDEGCVPSDLAAEIKQRNIKDLVPVANALSQGHDITREQWEKIAQAPDFSTVSRIVREDIKGAEPRKGSLVLSLDGVGTIWGFYDGERYFVGSLEIENDDPIIGKAINRIVQNSGILRG